MDFNSLHFIGNAHAELLLILIIRSWEVLYAKTRHFWNLYAHNQNLSLDSKLTDKGKVIKPKKNVSFLGTAVSHTDSILFDKRETTQFLKF